MPPKTIARAQELAVSLEVYRDGPLGNFLAAGTPFDIARAADPLPADGSQPVVIAPWLLQDIPDYRGALQRWFAAVAVGGVLIVTVPHAFLYERQDSAPSRRDPAQRRLYSPRALIEEIEEALVPNSYRVRWLGDLDQGYDYAAGEAIGQCEVAVAIERIALPSWGLTEPVVARPPPSDLFEPDRTRVERQIIVPTRRILALKLDHLGDFVMGISALERLRSAFPAAEITLVVGSWNEALAHMLAIADRVLIFDAYPRNSGEEPVDVPGKTALFDALVTASYDLAIDLRTDHDTRFLLRNVKAACKAGIGLKARHPFLDIFLPVEADFGHFDTAWSEEFGPDRFYAQDHCARSPFSIAWRGTAAREGEGAIVWGPYRPLPTGEYRFEPYLEIEPGSVGLIACDVALDTRRIVYAACPPTGKPELRFESKADHAQFEFRLYRIDREPLPDFRFYGGRLSKRGASNALHQSEYVTLLIDLVALRLTDTGVFGVPRA